MAIYHDLLADETELIGRWIVLDLDVEDDEVSERIKWLVANRLQRLTTSPSGWETLFQDPRDSRFWELSSPQGAPEGWGPPRLRYLSLAEATAKYRLGTG